MFLNIKTNNFHVSNSNQTKSYMHMRAGMCVHMALIVRAHTDTHTGYHTPSEWKRALLGRMDSRWERSETSKSDQRCK